MFAAFLFCVERCPSGDNPYTCEDEEDCNGISQTGGILVGEFGNKCHVECSNRGTCDRSTGTCTCYLGSIGVACERLSGGIFLPACLPTSQPSSYPTSVFRPTSSPTGQPSSTPSVAPSGILYLPSNISECVTVSENKTSVTVFCTLDIFLMDWEALVYCSGYLTDKNLEEHQSEPFSADEVIVQNNFAISDRGNATVTVNGLRPSTSYYIYCATVSVVGSITSLHEIITSKTRLPSVTTCCKKVIIDVTQQPLIEGKFKTDAVSITISSVPANMFDVNLTMFVVNGNTTTNIITQNVSFSSPYIRITAHAVSLTVTTDVFCSFGTVGTYAVNASLGGISGDEYEITFRRNILTVLDARTTSPTPTLVSAEFAPNGGTIVIQFDSDTDRGLVADVTFPCENLFDFVGNVDSTCVWSDFATMVITPSFQIIPDTYNISVVNNTMRALCIDDPFEPCSTWVPVDSSQRLLILGPAEPVVPKVVAIGPAIIGGCANLTFDISSASTGSGGRAWVGRPVFELLSTTALNTSAFVSFLNDNYQMVPPTPVNSSLLEAGKEYTLSIRLCSFLNECGTGLYNFRVDNALVLPGVSILGATNRNTLAKNAVVLSSNAYTMQCDGKVSISNFTYRWRVYPFNQAIASATIFSTSVDVSKFRTDPFVLQPNFNYRVEVLVTDLGTGLATIASTTVTVVRGNVVAAIAGGLQLAISYNSALSADGRGSFDEDDPTASPDNVDYHWVCNSLTPNYALTCPFAFWPEDAYKSVFRFNATTEIPLSRALNVTARLVLSVWDRTGTRVSTATTTIVTVPPNSPFITLKADQQNFPVTKKVTFTAAISSASSCNFKWNVNASDVVVPTTVVTVTGGVFTKLFLSIIPNKLKPRFTYLFSATCGVSTASVLVVTNGPPVFGSFNVIPARGGLAIITQYFFMAEDWLDEDLPLTYTFGFISTTAAPVSAGANGTAAVVIPGGGTMVVVRSESEVRYGYTMLPDGAAEAEYNSTTVVYVLDSLRSSVLAYADVQVLPSISGNTTVTAESNVTITAPPSNQDIQAVLDAVTANPVVGSSSSAVDTNKQIIGVFTSLINTVVCTLAPNCTKLHRNKCSLIANTCGACVAGYVGTGSAVGPSNTQCVSTSAVSSSPSGSGGSSCTTDSDCGTFSECRSGSCAVPSKECANNCSSPAAGVCAFVGTDSGKNLTDCRMDDSTCEAVCECFSGYGGNDCGLSPVEFSAAVTVRSSLISTLKSLVAVEEPSDTVVSGWMSSINSLSQNPSLLEDASNSDLLDSAVLITSVALSLDTEPDTLQEILVAVDNVGIAARFMEESSVNSSVLLRKAVGDSLTVVNSYATARLKSMVSGDSDYAAVHQTFRISATVAQINSNAASVDISTKVPQTDFERLSGRPASVISLPTDSVFPSGPVSGTEGDSSSLGMSIMSMRKAQYGRGTRVNANPISLTLTATGAAASTMQTGQNSATAYEPVMPLTMYNVDEEAYPMTQHNVSFSTICIPFLVESHTYKCPGNVPNITHNCTGTGEVIQSNCSTTVPIPECTNIVGITPEIETDSSLEFYSTLRTDCKVPVVANTVTSNRRRRLQTLSDDEAATFNYLPVTTVAVDRYFPLPVTDIGIDYGFRGALAIYLFKTLLVIVAICALVYYYYYYHFLEHKRQYAAKIAELEAATEKEKDLESPQAIKRIQEGEEEERDVYQYIDDLFPQVFLLSRKSAWARAVDELVHYHKLLHVFYAPTPRTKVVRNKIALAVCYCATFAIMLVFMLTVLFTADVPVNDKHCLHRLDEATCTDGASPFETEKTVCVWTSELDGQGKAVFACTHRAVSFRMETIIYMGVITALCGGVYEAFLEYCFQVIASPVDSEREMEQIAARAALRVVKSARKSVRWMRKYAIVVMDGRNKNQDAEGQDEYSDSKGGSRPSIFSSVRSSLLALGASSRSTIVSPTTGEKGDEKETPESVNTVDRRRSIADVFASVRNSIVGTGGSADDSVVEKKEEKQGRESSDEEEEEGDTFAVEDTAFAALETRPVSLYGKARKLSVTLSASAADVLASIKQDADEEPGGVAAAPLRARRMSTQSLETAAQLMQSRGSICALADAAGSAVKVELSRRNQQRHSIRQSICGQVNIGGNRMVAGGALVDFDELYSDLQAQYSMLRTEKDRSAFVNSWRLKRVTEVAPAVVDGQRKGPRSSIVVGDFSRDRMETFMADSKVLYKTKVEEMRSAGEVQVAVEMIRLFVHDVLGRGSEEAAVFATKSEADFDQPEPVSMGYKMVVVSFLSALNIIFIALTFWLAGPRELAWQVALVCTCIIEVFVLLVLGEALAVLCCSYIIPSLVAEEVQKVYKLLYKLALNMSMLQLHKDSSAVPILLDVPSFFFVSTRLARHHQQLFESLLVLSYESFSPGKMAEFWEVKVAPRGMFNPFSAAYDRIIAGLKGFGAYSMVTQMMLVKLVQPAIFSVIALLLGLFIRRPVFLALLLLFPVCVASYYAAAHVVHQHNSNTSVQPDAEHEDEEDYIRPELAEESESSSSEEEEEDDSSGSEEGINVVLEDMSVASADSEDKAEAIAQSLDATMGPVVQLSDAEDEDSWDDAKDGSDELGPADAPVPVPRPESTARPSSLSTTLNISPYKPVQPQLKSPLSSSAGSKTNLLRALGKKVDERRPTVENSNNPTVHDINKLTQIFSPPKLNYTADRVRQTKAAMPRNSNLTAAPSSALFVGDSGMSTTSPVHAGVPAEAEWDSFDGDGNGADDQTLDGMNSSSPIAKEFSVDSAYHTVINNLGPAPARPAISSRAPFDTTGSVGVSSILRNQAVHGDTSGLHSSATPVIRPSSSIIGRTLSSHLASPAPSVQLESSRAYVSSMAEHQAQGQGHSHRSAVLGGDDRACSPDEQPVDNDEHIMLSDDDGSGVSESGDEGFEEEIEDEAKKEEEEEGEQGHEAGWEEDDDEGGRELSVAGAAAIGRRGDDDSVIVDYDIGSGEDDDDYDEGSRELSVAGAAAIGRRGDDDSVIVDYDIGSGEDDGDYDAVTRGQRVYASVEPASTGDYDSGSEAVRAVNAHWGASDSSYADHGGDADSSVLGAVRFPSDTSPAHSPSPGPMQGSLMFEE